MFMSKAKIYFIRHGQTDSNATGILYKGDDDTHGLNETGKEQARIAGVKLAGVNFGKVFSGTYLRHLQTAQIICDGRDIKIETDARLNERNFGEFAGMRYKPIEKAEFDIKSFFLWGDHQVYKSAETMQDCEDRIHGFLKEIKSKYPGQNILAVGSGGSGVHAKSFVHGRANGYYLHNCEIFEINNEIGD